jgi:hypothetical protein
MKDHGTYLVPTVYLEDWLMENYKKLGFTTSMIEKTNLVIPIRGSIFRTRSSRD